MNILIDDINNWLDGQAHKVEIIKNVVKASIEEESFTEDVEVSITLGDNEMIRQINFDHRNIDKVTDVISFPQIDWTYEGGSDYNTITGQSTILGDIVISVDQLIKQAKEYNHSIERELGFLIAHSMFHLLGYDHMNEEDEANMIAKQEKVLKKLGLVR